MYVFITNTEDEVFRTTQTLHFIKSSRNTNNGRQVEKCTVIQQSTRQTMHSETQDALDHLLKKAKDERYALYENFGSGVDYEYIVRPDNWQRLTSPPGLEPKYEKLVVAGPDGEIHMSLDDPIEEVNERTDTDVFALQTEVRDDLEYEDVESAKDIEEGEKVHIEHEDGTVTKEEVEEVRELTLETKSGSYSRKTGGGWGPIESKIVVPKN